MPPLMLTAPEATTVALSLLTARRDGLDAEGALAKIRRVLPDQVRLRVEALEQTLSFTATGHEPVPPRAENLLSLADAALRGRRVHAVYVASDGARSERDSAPMASSRIAVAGTCPLTTMAEANPALCAPTVFTPSGCAARGDPRHRTSTPSNSSAARSRACRGSTRSKCSCTPRSRARLRASRPHSPSSSPRARPTLLRMRAESLDWVAGLLAGAGCAFTIRRPDDLRRGVHALADRLHAA